MNPKFNNNNNNKNNYYNNNNNYNNYNNYNSKFKTQLQQQPYHEEARQPPYNPRVHVDEDKNVNIENMNCFFKDNDSSLDGYYLPTVGITNCKINEPNELKRDQSIIFFKILDAHKIPYAIFAGNSIGLIRNGKSIPWSDDYDIIILNNHIHLLVDILPILYKNGLKAFKNKNIYTNQFTGGGFNITSEIIHKYYYTDENTTTTRREEEENEETLKYKRSIFGCDVYYSHFDKNGFLRNNGSWGLYHVKQLHIKDVVPFKLRSFDEMPTPLPFFNNVSSEVYKTYGNIEECIISTHSFKGCKSKYKSWRTAYEDFENIKSKALKNTMQHIYKDYKPENKKNVMKILDDKFNKNQIDILYEIGKNNISKIYAFSIDFIIQHAISIKFYFPEVIIEYFSYAREREVILYLNYVDVLHAFNGMIKSFYDDPQLVYLKKPRIDIIKVITFGTYDMWHVGHSNLLSRCCKYSENICVGVSTDEFTFQKKKIHPTDNFKKRSENVNKCKFVKKVFEETSMELKNNYIKKFDANILIMGDDWIDSFDWVDCCVIYLPRTPNISSTMLREQMNVKFLRQ